MMKTDYIKHKNINLHCDTAYLSSLITEREWLDALDALREKSMDPGFSSVYIRKDLPEDYFDKKRIDYDITDKYGTKHRTLVAHHILSCQLCTARCRCTDAAHEGKCLAFNVFHDAIRKERWVNKVDEE